MLPVLSRSLRTLESATSAAGAPMSGRCMKAVPMRRKRTATRNAGAHEIHSSFKVRLLPPHRLESHF